MNFLYLTHFLNGFLMILIPVALGYYLARRFRLGWRLWWIGAATFVLSQVGHLPFNYALTLLFRGGVLPSPPEEYSLIFNALVLGLSAGLWEEIARYLAYRFWAKDARSWSRGLLMGAGHGGIEAILLGVIVLVNFFVMIVLSNSDLVSMVPADQIEPARQQISTYWGMPWYDPLLGALERVSAITFHLAASVIVLQVFLRKQIRWLFLAVGLHTLFNAVAVYAVATWGPYLTEALLAGIALLCLGLIFWLRSPDPDDEIVVDPRLSLPIPPASGDELSIPEIEETPENLDQTRYT
jgi:uncharacterized membrane protein YhfC